MFDNRLADPDGFYQALLDTHAGLSLDESHALNARLVLILSNLVGDMPLLRTALAAAREGAVCSKPSDDSSGTTP